MLCSWWKVREESLQSVLDNWGAVNMLWDNSVEWMELIFCCLCFTTPK